MSEIEGDWWDDLEEYDFDLRRLTEEVLEIKRQRRDALVLAPRSYDFVVYLGNII